MTNVYKPFRNFKGENWRQVGDTDYWVSDCGRIKHVYKNGHEHLLHPYHVKNRKRNCIVIKIMGKEMIFPRLVYETFRGPLPDYKWVVHIDHDLHNNYLDNLAVTDAHRSGKHSGWMSITDKMRPVVCLANGKIYPSTRACGKALGISYQTVTDHCNGIRKRTKDKYQIRWATEKEAEQLKENYERAKMGLPKRHKKIRGG